MTQHDKTIVLQIIWLFPWKKCLWCSCLRVGRQADKDFFSTHNCVMLNQKNISRNSNIFVVWPWVNRLKCQLNLICEEPSPGNISHDLILTIKRLMIMEQKRAGKFPTTSFSFCTKKKNNFWDNLGLFRLRDNFIAKIWNILWVIAVGCIRLCWNKNHPKFRMMPKKVFFSTCLILCTCQLSNKKIILSIFSHPSLFFWDADNLTKTHSSAITSRCALSLTRSSQRFRFRLVALALFFLSYIIFIGKIAEKCFVVYWIL